MKYFTAMFHGAAMTVALALTACGGGGGGSAGGAGGSRPSVSLKANPTSITAGGSTKLSWTVGHATLCTASGGWTGTRSAAGGEETVFDLGAATTYTLTCTDGALEASDSVTVSVQAPPTAGSLVSRTLDFGPSTEAGGLAAAPSRSALYATLSRRNELLEISTDDYTARAHFYVGPQPGAIAVSADESRAYVALTYGGAIAVVDLATRAVRRIEVASALGSRWVTAVREVRPGVVLVGASITRGGTRLITVDVEHHDAITVVASGQSVMVAASIAISPDQRFVYVADAAGGADSALLKLDATQQSLPLLARSGPVATVRTLAVGRDGSRLVSGIGFTYDAATLAALSGPGTEGSVGAARGSTRIVRAEGAMTVEDLDPVTLVARTTYQNDCPARRVDGIVASERRSEWVLNLAGVLCVVSLSTPSVAPGVAADRTLSFFVPDETVTTWTEIPMIGGTDLALDDARGLAYVAVPMQQRVAVVSLSPLAEIDSIAVPGEIRYVFPSADGQRLYGGLFDQGRVVSIDLNTRQVVANVDIGAQLGRVAVRSIAEVAPNELVVGADGPFAEETYLVHVRLGAPQDAERIGCAQPYGGVMVWPSPDRHYLYVATNSERCPLLEKRDLTKEGFPLVKGSDPGSTANLGRQAMTSDGAYILGQEGDVVSSSTLWVSGYVGFAGQPIASSDPDRFYLASEAGVSTYRVRDYSLRHSVLYGCWSTRARGIARSFATRDESKFVLLGHDEGLCIVDAQPKAAAVSR